MADKLKAGVIGLGVGARHIDPYTSFVNAVRDNTVYLVRPEEGVTVMKLLDAIYLSAQDGVPVKIS